jgi:hypothetical protein
MHRDVTPTVPHTMYSWRHDADIAVRQSIEQLQRQQGRQLGGEVEDLDLFNGETAKEAGFRDGGRQDGEPFRARSWRFCEGEWEEKHAVGGEKARKELGRILQGGVNGDVGGVVKLREATYTILDKSGRFPT